MTIRPSFCAHEARTTAPLHRALNCGVSARVAFAGTILMLLLSWRTVSAQMLTSGTLYTNSIAANQTNSYTFTASVGESVIVRVGEMTSAGQFQPWLRIIGPDGTTVVGSGSTAGEVSEEVAITTTNSGTFTVLVSDGTYSGTGGTGTYQLTYLALPGSFSVSTGDEGGAMVNGTLNSGTISVGDLDAWSFSANAGDSIIVRVGQLSSAGQFQPWLRVYGPDGSLVGAGNTAGAAGEEVTLTATNGGTYTAVVSDGNYSGFGGTGDYQLSYIALPGGFSVSAGDEGGPMTNGALYPGTITVGDLDVWSFSANTGDSIIVRVGELTSAGQFQPWLRVYGPDGSLEGAGNVNGELSEEVTLTATNGGTFTVVVSDGIYSGIGGTGDYQLSYVALPGGFSVSAGDEGGPMINGAMNSGTITVGDLDMWSFSANTGDSVIVRVGQLTSAGQFQPWLRVYGPDGALVGAGNTAGAAGEEAAFIATNGGTFTAVVSDGNYSGFGGTGDYQLSYIALPGSFSVLAGDEGGAMTNGAMYPGTITVGDLDEWSFGADAGDSIIVRVGELSSAGQFQPWLRVYGPDGALVGSGNANGDVGEEVAVTATNGGTFTAVVSDGLYSGIGGTGDYQVGFVKTPGTIVVSPGDEGGTLTNGILNTGTITTGDLDAWDFTASAGDSVVLRLAALTSTNQFQPLMRVYGPDGALIASGNVNGEASSEIAFTSTNSGDYVVLISDGNYSGIYGSGMYNLSLAHAPGDVFVSPGDEGGAMTNGVTYTGTNLLGDLDVWSFYGTAGDSNTFRIGTTNFTPWLRLYGPSGALVAQAFTASTGNRTNTLTYVVTNSGNYVLVASSYYVTQSGTYALKQSRVPPDLIVPDTQVLDEGDTLSVTISAQDPDVPVQPLTFTAISLPTGANFSQTGATNATITWATTESSGPSTNVIVASVTDVVNGQPFIRTNSFTVVVNEINEPPQLTVPLTQTINELTPLNVSASATDPDIPANALTFGLVSPPSGMAIDPDTGAISWTPTEAQGPSTNTVTVVVTDDNPWAVNQQQFSVTNSFTVYVQEINLAPQLAVPGTQTIDEMTALNVSASATDPDLPANGLTFGLISPPSGMTINPTSGAISWTPTEAQGPSTNSIMVVVTDSNPLAVNAQHLSTTNSFTVNVREVNTAPQLTVPTNQTVDELTALNVSASATDSDIPANPLTFSLISPPAGMTINASSGAISWTPTEAQGPSTNTIKVVVTDNNPAAATQHLSATNSFTVVVNEVNTAPQLTVPADQTVDELTVLNVSASATDSDVPANPLTFSLVSPPAGMTINPNSGAISWTPTEAQGPSTNTIKVVVTDDNSAAVNQHLSATNSFTVVVNEVNTAPQLTVPADQTVDELTALNVSASATDSDVPTNPLTFSLVSPPAGMTINGASGAISWTPTEAQGPSTNMITVVVTDTNSAAASNSQLSTTNTFKVIVREVNVAPQLAAITNQSVHFGILLSVQATATDTDVPANTLTFSLLQSPTNMSINASSGLITWTPLQTQVGAHTITVRVADNGAPSMSATQSFQVTVTGNSSQLEIVPLAGGLKQLNITGDTGLQYDLQVSTNLTSWDSLIQINLTTSPYPYIDPNSATIPKRYYRLKLIQQ